MCDPRVGWREEPKALNEQWRRLACPESASPKLWMDAYLAAFSICDGLQLVTIDKAFLQHSGLECKLLKLPPRNTR